MHGVSKLVTEGNLDLFDGDAILETLKNVLNYFKSISKSSVSIMAHPPLKPSSFPGPDVTSLAWSTDISFIFAKKRVLTINFKLSFTSSIHVKI